MQMGPSHDPVSWTSGVWPLRILISSRLDVFRFIVSTISAISISPVASRCRPQATIDIHRANFSKSRCFAVRRGCALKNGMTLSNRSSRRFHDELAQVLAMIVMARGRVDPADPEEVLQLLQSRTAVHALRHNKPMRHLKAGLVAPAPRPIRLSDEADGEASLSAYKTSNPAELNQPFLLVSCTRHVVTVAPTRDGTRSAGYPGFPAYSQMRTAQLPARGATFLP